MNRKFPLFSSKQTALHDTIVYTPEDPSNITFAYPLSDDKKRIAFVSHVIQDLRKKWENMRAVLLQVHIPFLFKFGKELKEASLDLL